MSYLAGTCYSKVLGRPGMLRQLGLEPPPAIMRLAARRSARRYRRQHTATG